MVVLILEPETAIYLRYSQAKPKFGVDAGLVYGVNKILLEVPGNGSPGPP